MKDCSAVSLRAQPIEVTLAKNRKERAPHQADTRGKGWSGLPHVVADSAAYLSLNPFERSVFGEIIRRFHGHNNGRIAITYEEIGDRLKGRNRCRPNNARIARAIGRLIKVGLLAEPSPGSWLQRRAREYRLTFASSGVGPPYRGATNEYLQWTPSDDCSVTMCHQRGGSVVTLAHYGDPALVTGRHQVKAGLGDRVCQLAGDAGSSLICEPYPDAANVVRVYPQGVPQGFGRCEACGRRFERQSQPRTKKYCSGTCRKRAEHRRAADRRRLSSTKPT